MKSQKLTPSPRPSTNLRGEKICMSGCIRPTRKFLTHPRTSFSINELWPNKYDIKKSTINKRRLERITWRKFYIKQSNPLKRTSLNTQPAPLPQPSTNRWGKKIQDQLILIQLMRTQRSTINNARMITKTQNNSTWRIINCRHYYNL